MASTEAVARAVRALTECFPHREISDNTVPVYAIALQDVADADLNRAVRRALRESKFFPSPAELRELAGLNRAAAFDLEGILTRIHALFCYLPTQGEIPPAVSAVRNALGDGIAQAYGSVGGGDRLFSGNETTRSIARREFAEELKVAIRDLGAAAVLAPMQQPLAIAPTQSLVIYGARPERDAGPRLLAAALPSSPEST